MNGIRQRLGQFAHRPGSICAMFGDQIDQGRSDHYAVRHLGDRGGLFRRAHTEADCDGDLGVLLDPGNRLIDRGLRGLLHTGDPGDRDVVEEPR